MPYAPHHDRPTFPRLARVAYGLGTVLRGSVEVATFPYRSVRRLVGRRRREQAQGTVHPDARYEAAHIAADEGLGALARALADPDPTTRTTALDVICELSGKRAARLLAGVLHDPDPDVRAAAAGAAAEIGATGTVFSLILALDDPARRVRAAAARAIEVITGRPVEPEQGGDPARRQQQIEQLKQWWKEERFAELASEAALRPSR